MRAAPRPPAASPTRAQAAETGASKAAGWSEEQTVQIRRGEVEGDDKTTALLAFARELVDKQGWLTDGTWQQTLDAGWSQEQVLEAFGSSGRR